MPARDEPARTVSEEAELAAYLDRTANLTASTGGFDPKQPYTGGEGSGYGVFSFFTGDVYEGEWRDDKHEGQGKITTAEGLVLIR